MYLGDKKANLVAVDNGIVAAVAPNAKPEALFVPEAWGAELAPAAEVTEVEVAAPATTKAEATV